jgi:gamma-glutamyl:cysteine ligase YbdK (ATP-grasp superfamily)
MSGSELATRVRDVLDTDSEEFAARVEREVEVLKSELADGTFDNPQGVVGLEYEFYAVDAETKALARVPRRLLEYVGFEKELGLHNAEMQTSPQPLSGHGLRAQEAEVKARLAAAEEVAVAEGLRLVSDGMWTQPPVGETATSYLANSVESEGVRLATNMSDAVRYHAMANTDFGAEMSLDAFGVELDADTVMPESLITSIQPHYQVPQADDLPAYFRYALRVAGPLLALGVNSPFFPPDLYVEEPAVVVAESPDENRIDVFESVLNPADAPKVKFPRDLETVDDAVDRVAADRTVVPELQGTAGRFDDRFAHYRHKHGSYWRWVRPVIEGASRKSANARIEFRPIAGQPTVRDSIAFLAAFAGLMESLPRLEHPVYGQDWGTAEANFYAAAENGLDADLHWVTADGEETTDTAALYAELFEYARDGLERNGVAPEAANRYLRPLRERVDRGVTPASWKRERVRERFDAGEPFAEAVWGMQAEYIDAQSDTLIEGSFVDWL